MASHDTIWPMRLLLLVALTLGASTGWSKDLRDRFGAGLGLHDFNNTPTVSIRYVPETGGFTTTAQVGFNTSASSGSTVIGAKIQQNAASEENINFFFGLAAYMLLNKIGGGATASGFELDVLMGAEFFLSGLPNLGIELQTGLAYRSIQGTAFRTVGSGFLGSAFHYYF